MHFLEWKLYILITFSLKFVPKGPISNIPELVQIMAWRMPGDKRLSESMMISLLTHICVTRPQWVNKHLHYDKKITSSCSEESIQRRYITSYVHIEMFWETYIIRKNTFYILTTNHFWRIFKGLRPILEGFVVPMHEGACETGSQIPRA